MKDIIKAHLEKAQLMQLATSSDNQPWVCSVYFVIDDLLNNYWLSLPTRRHSKEIKNNNMVAGTMVVKKQRPVIGVCVEGKASVVSDKITVKKIMNIYTEKYDEGHDFYENFVSGRNQHCLYSLRPKKYVLFDEVNFPKNPYKIITI